MAAPKMPYDVHPHPAELASKLCITQSEDLLHVNLTIQMCCLQAEVHSAWVAQKDEQRRREEAQAAAQLQRLPDWFRHSAAAKQRNTAQDFAAW